MMIRRDFLAISSAFAAVSPLRGRAETGRDALTFKPGVLAEHLRKGATVFLTFKASWCATCAAQTRVLEKLKAENAADVRRVTFIDADWDTYGRAQFATRMRIPRHGTLVVLKGDEELGRIVADTGEEKIRGLLSIATAAARAG